MNRFKCVIFAALFIAGQSLMAMKALIKKQEWVAQKLQKEAVRRKRIKKIIDNGFKNKQEFTDLESQWYAVVEYTIEKIDRTSLKDCAEYAQQMLERLPKKDKYQLRVEESKQVFEWWLILKSSFSEEQLKEEKEKINNLFDQWEKGRDYTAIVVEPNRYPWNPLPAQVQVIAENVEKAFQMETRKEIRKLYFERLLFKYLSIKSLELEHTQRLNRLMQKLANEAGSLWKNPNPM